MTLGLKHTMFELGFWQLLSNTCMYTFLLPNLFVQKQSSIHSFLVELYLFLIWKRHLIFIRGACSSRNSTRESQKSLKQHHKLEITSSNLLFTRGSSMVPYGSLRSHLVLMIPYGYIWSRMVPYAPLWSCMLPYGPIWSRMVPYGPLWSRMPPYGPVWSRMVLYGPLNTSKFKVTCG